VSDLLDLRTVNATLHSGPCAEVRVGEHVTRYVRRGSGPSVVVLGRDAETGPFWGPLVERLGARFRVIVPQPPSQDIDTSEWLRGFIEGLGVSSIALLAGAGFRDAALDLAAVDDLTVRRLVLLPDDAASVGGSGCRTLRILPDWELSEAIRRVEQFLSNEEL